MDDSIVSSLAAAGILNLNLTPAENKPQAKVEPAPAPAPGPPTAALQRRIGTITASKPLGGIIRTTLPPAKGPVHLPPPVNVGPIPIDSGLLKHIPPRVGYSSVLKAFAFALRPFITLDEDLSASGKVFLVGGPMQYAIPTSLDDERYLNEALFSTCDPIQSADTPVYSAVGMGYFEWLRAYVRNVEDLSQADQQAVSKATAEYQAAVKNSETEFRNALENFKAAVAVDPKLTFIEWMNAPFGKAYRDACDDRDRKQKKLKDLQGSELSDVNRVLATLDSARSRLEPKRGSNMPCALRDIPSHDGTDTTYLPLYYLSGYALASKHWIMDGDTGSQSIAFNPVSGNKQLWHRLGLPTLVNSTSTDSPAWMKDVTVIVKFRGIGAFDVRRGLWDITGLKAVLPPLKKTAVPTLKSPILKTTKVLIAYGVEVVIQLPAEISKKIRGLMSKQTITVLPELLGNLAATWNPDGNLEASLAKGNAYPVLLGVLAQWVNNGDE
ncbi:hypothetical protein PRK78_004604 [Emydomyces testavorans]|uniref:Uncharacterized protein n=1 Tax=Emydomyces testavorans TaxID=2070801 RepID=A0AAF0DLT8_9EURO|nr:hypothetical protein PRK78_004604 [Emydomyces testavorans]